MEFRILGPLEVVEGGRSIPLGGAKQRALLAILLTRANEVVSSDRLVDELWGEAPPKAAVNTVQYYVSQLRKLLGADRIVTRPPGYLIRVEAGELDLARFERLVESGGPEELREGLRLWRGQALADFAYEPFAQPEITRLEELRLAALEKRIEADLERGRHAEVVGEVDALVAEHPLRERLRQQLMLALYRSGRQADALEAYQSARRALVEELGLEPSLALQELEKAILRQDPGLTTPAAEPAAPDRSILVVLRDARNLGALLAVAEPLARRPPREVILASVVAEGAELRTVTALLNERREALLGRGVSARAAAFTSAEPSIDIVRLALQQGVDLLLMDAGPGLLDDPELRAVLSDAPCDVAVLPDSRPLGAGGPVLAPFSGADHDWAAVEVAAWLAGALGVSLTLLGSEAAGGRRDASRLLASASLLVQRALGVATEPLLVPPGDEGIVRASGDAALVVLGLSPRWRQEGLGETRLAITRSARPPTLLVRRGPRPGGLAPEKSLTRFTWSLAQRDH